MLFKGINFRKANDIVQMPARDNFGNLMPYVEKDRENYVVFGKIVKVLDRENPPKDAYPTRYRMSDTGEIVFAKPIESEGHSLTNMMYGKNNSVYLMTGGSFFRGKLK